MHTHSGKVVIFLVVAHVVCFISNPKTLEDYIHISG